MLPLNAERAGRLVRDPRWPWVVMAVCALVLVLEDSGVVVRRVPLPLLVVVGTGIAAAGWVILDWAVRRLGTRWVAVGVVAVAVGFIVAVVVAFFDPVVLQAGKSGAARLAAIAFAAVAIGAYLRAAVGRGSRLGQLVVAAAMVSWVAYLDLKVLGGPFRDAQLYLRAGRLFLHHQPVYLSSVLTTFPTDHTLLPYLYPPFTLPLFAGLALLPNAVAIAIMEVLCTAAVVAGLRLLGVRWAFVPVLLCWPPLAIGIQVGNVACFGFLVLAAGWRAAASLPLGAVFKAQTGVLSLWLVRERRWRALAVGVGAVAALALLTLPLTGVSAYWDWFRALGYFETSLARHPTAMMGIALQRSIGQVGALLLAGAAIAVALLGRRRDGLARSAIASVVASPTVYVHGFSLLLPSLLLLDAASAWGILGLSPWGSAPWWGAAATLAALVLGLTRARLGLVGPVDAASDGAAPSDGERAPFDAPFHPLGRLLEPWPDPPSPGEPGVRRRGAA